LVDHASTGAIQIVARGLTGDEHGTAQNTFYIGDGTAGSKTLTFNAITDASIIWDETKFDFGANSILVGGLDAVASNGDCDITVEEYQNNLFGPGFFSKKARGTSASPIALQNLDEFGKFSCFAYDGDEFLLRASIIAEVMGTVSNDDIPAGWTFNVSSGGDVVEAMRIDPNGLLGFNTITPTAQVDVNSDILRLRTAKTPDGPSDTGNQGDIGWDSSYIYVCVATDTWKRTVLSTWTVPGRLLLETGDKLLLETGDNLLTE